MKNNLGLIRPAFGVGPRDLTSTTNVVGDWVSLANYDSVVVAFLIADSADAQDIRCDVQQATSAAGAGAKTISPETFWVQQHATDPNAAVFVENAGVDTVQVEGANAGLVVVEITGDMLDDGFTFVAGRYRRRNGAGTKIGGITYVMGGARYANALDDVPAINA